METRGASFIHLLVQKLQLTNRFFQFFSSTSVWKLKTSLDLTGITRLIWDLWANLFLLGEWGFPRPLNTPPSGPVETSRFVFSAFHSRCHSSSGGPGHLSRNYPTGWGGCEDERGESQSCSVKGLSDWGFWIHLPPPHRHFSVAHSLTFPRRQ